MLDAYDVEVHIRESRNRGIETVMEGSFIVLQGTQTTEMSMAPGLAPASVLTQCTVQAKQLQSSPKGCGVKSRTARKSAAGMLRQH
ncbi:hypothetical protein IscW_ISCW010696 [Ixodes scapularis]|uniref:Uncharacterized protein n=1 Tax=Ixodes scapularis TaxID=6945 RepID=B7Q7F7_IXOSC|nr:hypothetical protein IscW_ISCW010696 [Ixodes scapularis]|eukprot:XP_002403971.1 hypothetical protein IscW_ISCW010696 [Ixodes scapularis]